MESRFESEAAHQVRTAGLAESTGCKTYFGHYRTFRPNVTRAITRGKISVPGWYTGSVPSAYTREGEVRFLYWEPDSVVSIGMQRGLINRGLSPD